MSREHLARTLRLAMEKKIQPSTADGQQRWALALKRAEELKSKSTPASSPNGFALRAQSSESFAEVWLVQKNDGLDYGPFRKSDVIDMLHRDDIHENNIILNMLTQERSKMADVPEFREDVSAYVPVREARLEQERKARQRRVQQLKKTGKLSGASVLMAALVIVTGAALAYFSLPEPAPTELHKSVVMELPRFEMPVAEEISIQLDTGLQNALFDPKKSAEERARALDEWDAAQRRNVQRKSRSKKSKSRASSRPKTTTTPMDGVILTPGEGGVELEPLEDWEITDVVYTAPNLRKITQCFDASYQGRAIRLKVTFRIDPRTGMVRQLSTNKRGELDGCMKRVFRSLHFRASGGTPKRVTLPFEFG